LSNQPGFFVGVLPARWAVVAGRVLMQQATRMICGKRELMKFFGIGEKKLMKWIKELGCPAYPDTQGVYRASARSLERWYAEVFADKGCRLTPPPIRQ
jgi:hypothetical protein